MKSCLVCLVNYYKIVCNQTGEKYSQPPTDYVTVYQPLFFWVIFIRLWWLVRWISCLWTDGLRTTYCCWSWSRMQNSTICSLTRWQLTPTDAVCTSLCSCSAINHKTLLYTTAFPYQPIIHSHYSGIYIILVVQFDFDFAECIPAGYEMRSQAQEQWVFNRHSFFHHMVAQ